MHTGRKKLEKSKTLGLSLAFSNFPETGSKPGGSALWTQVTHCSVNTIYCRRVSQSQSRGLGREGQGGLWEEWQPNRLGSLLTYIYLLPDRSGWLLAWQGRTQRAEPTVDLDFFSQPIKTVNDLIS